MDDKSAGDDVRITRAVIGVLLEHDLSGFEIWQWVGPVHGNTGALSERTLYPTLYRLEAIGLITSSWHEDEDPRRKYRITATGKRRALEEGWGPIAAGRFRRPGSGGDGTEEDDEDWVWPPETRLLPGDDALPPGSPEEAAVAAYVDRLSRGLRLARIHLGDARNEINDHIADSAGRLRSRGSTCADAAAFAIEALGPPDTLADAINVSQLSQGRLQTALWWGGAVAIATGLVTFGLSLGAVLIGTPIVGGLISVLAAAVGVNLYVPDTAELGAQGFALAAAVAAFTAARRSTPTVADRSRRAEYDVWRPWALTGAIPLAALVLILPTSLDPLTVAALVSIPGAWVLGTRRPAPFTGDSVTPGGVLRVAALVFVFMFLPGGRIWTYDPTSLPAVAPPQGDVTATIVWQGAERSPVQSVTVSGLPDGWQAAQVEIWQAHRIGPFVIPETGTVFPEATIDSGKSLDFSSIGLGHQDWWAVATAVDPTGRRRSVATAVQFGYPAGNATSILVTLLGAVRP